MDRSTTAREALVAELIGDLARLLDRIDTLKPAIDDASDRVANAAWDLSSRVSPFKAEMAAIAQTTKDTVQEHIERATRNAAVKLLQVQMQVLSASARKLFDQEVAAKLRELAAKLEELVVRMERTWWHDWALHLSTAMLSAACSAMLVVQWVYR